MANAGKKGLEKTTSAEAKIMEQMAQLQAKLEQKREEKLRNAHKAIARAADKSGLRLLCLPASELVPLFTKIVDQIRAERGEDFEGDAGAGEGEGDESDADAQSAEAGAEAESNGGETADEDRRGGFFRRD